jgi:hypothetical protein
MTPEERTVVGLEVLQMIEKLIQSKDARIQELEKLVAEGCDVVEKDIDRIAEAKKEERTYWHEFIRLNFKNEKEAYEKGFKAGRASNG